MGLDSPASCKFEAALVQIPELPCMQQEPVWTWDRNSIYFGNNFVRPIG